jgi:hypothetical protein
MVHALPAIYRVLGFYFAFCLLVFLAIGIRLRVEAVGSYEESRELHSIDRLQTAWTPYLPAFAPHAAGSRIRDLRPSPVAEGHQDHSRVPMPGLVGLGYLDQSVGLAAPVGVFLCLKPAADAVSCSSMPSDQIP